MNPLPIIALAAVAGGYGLAIDRLNDQFAEPPLQQASYSQQMANDLAVYDLIEKAAPALDAPRCEMEAVMANILQRDYAETPVEQRVVGDGLHVELWGSTEMGTWTIVHNGNDGMACVVSSGIGWTEQSSADQIFQDAPLAS